MVVPVVAGIAGGSGVSKVKKAILSPVNTSSKIIAGDLPLVTIAKWALIILIICGVLHISVDLVIRHVLHFINGLNTSVEIGITAINPFAWLTGNTIVDTAEKAIIGYMSVENLIFTMLWFLRCFIYICVAILTFIFMWTWIFKGLDFLVKINHHIDKFEQWLYKGDEPIGEMPTISMK